MNCNNLRHYLGILCVVCGILVLETTPLQAGRLSDHTVQNQDRNLVKVLKEMSSIYEVFFSYEEDMIRDVTVKFEFKSNESFEAAMQRLLTKTGLKYRTFGEKFIVVFRDNQEGRKGSKKIGRKLKQLERIERSSQIQLQPNRQDADAKIYTILKAVNQFPTMRPVSGKVVDESGLGLIGVNVMLKGTSNGTVTDIDGNFTLDIPEKAGDYILVFSYIGYETLEIAVNGRSQMEVKMTPSAAALEEVVVLGYGNVRRSDLTGSVAQVSESDLRAYPALSATQALQGRAAGVLVQSNNGAPGSTPKIRIRGATSINASSDPLFVVDGFINGIVPPPEDIASIEILKDASATAIYGSRGANGVVMITTKKGSIGRPTVELNVSYSVQKDIKRLQLLNASQYVNYIQEVDPSYTSSGSDTDWQDLVLRDGAIGNYQLSVSGGSEDVNYYVSGTIFDQRGIIVNSDYQRYALNANLNINAGDKLTLGVRLYGQRATNDGVATQEGSGGTSNTGVVSAAYLFDPDQGIYDENRAFSVAKTGDPHNNPFAIATERTNQGVGDLLQANLSADYKITPSLKLTLTGGGNFNNSRSGAYLPTSLVAGAQTGGSGSFNVRKNTTVINENYLTFDRTFGDHSITLTGGYSYQKERFEQFSGGSQGFITDAALFWNLGGGSVYTQPSTGVSESEISSWFGRINYKLLDRYLITFNARYDGSSTFSKNNKYAFFPSGAFAWNIGREPFLADSEFLSDWKVRVSYGITGNRAISPYQTLASFGTELNIVNGQIVNAIRPNRVANDDLSWESTKQLNIGTDVDLLDGRINFTVDYYRMQTDDLLFQVPLPEYSGFSNQLKNIGSTENKGIELSLGLRNRFGQLNWETNINFSANRNKILSLPDGLDIFYASGPGHIVGLGNTQVLREGEPIGVFNGWNYLGVYQEGDDFVAGSGFEQEAGGAKFEDINNDGTLNNDDRTIIGDPNPDFIWGWNNTFSFKNFDLNFFFQGSQGNDILSYTLLELERLSGSANSTLRALDRWTPTNTNTDVPKANSGRSQRVSNRFVYDGSYIRLKNLSLGYSLPTSWLENANIQQLRLYISAQNILTITDYPGVDPEINYRASGATNSNRNLGLDYGTYPNVKSVTFGANIRF